MLENKLKNITEFCLDKETKNDAYTELNRYKNTLSIDEVKFISNKINNNYTTENCTWEWFEESDIPEMNYLCSKLGLIPGPLTILSAFSGAGKTFFAMDFAICVANNLKFLGEIEIEDPGKVIHLDFEMSEQMCQIYYWRLLNGYGLKSFKNISYEKPEWNLNSENAKELLTEKMTGKKLCIIDCLVAAIPGIDINDERVRQPLDMINRVSEKTGCAVIVIHHEPKATGADLLKTVKGNGAIISAAGGSIHLHRNDDGQIKVKLGKRRMVQEYETFYTLDDCGPRSERIKNTIGIKLNKISSRKIDVKIDILNLIKEAPAINAKAILFQIKGDNTNINNTLKNLIESNLVRTEGLKPIKHFITDDGLALLSYEVI